MKAQNAKAHRHAESSQLVLKSSHPRKKKEKRGKGGRKKQGNAGDRPSGPIDLPEWAFQILTKLQKKKRKKKEEEREEERRGLSPLVAWGA